MVMLVVLTSLVMLAQQTEPTIASNRSNLFQITDSAPSGWSFRSPHTNGTAWLYKAVSLVDTKQWGSNGDCIRYDAVLLQQLGVNLRRTSKGGVVVVPRPSEQPFANVTVAAADAYRRDVVVRGVGGEGYSLKEVGDTLYFGGAAPPLTSYVWLDQLGVGGEIEWSYSTGNGTWALVNGDGKPASAAVSSSAARFDLDRGGDYG